jgi:recombinational DNA repair protein (RecF pathway)
MHHDPTAAAPARPGRKRCAACRRTKSASDFYVTRGRLSAYCKDCQRAKSAAAYHRRRADPATAALMRDRDRRRKRLERARTGALDPERERRYGRARTVAVRQLIAAYRTEYEALLHQERQRQGAHHG